MSGRRESLMDEVEAVAGRLYIEEMSDSELTEVLLVMLRIERRIKNSGDTPGGLHLVQTSS